MLLDLLFARSLQRRHAIKPRFRRFQLGGKCEQGRLLTVAPREMHADGRPSPVQCSGTLIAGVPVAL